MLLQEFGTPGQTLGEPPDALPPRLVARVAAGPAFEGVVGRTGDSSWVIGVAKAGMEEGVAMIAGSCIIAPNGEIVARCSSGGDECIVARCDLDLGRSYRETTFDFAQHRRVEHYRMIVERTGRSAA